MLATLSNPQVRSIIAQHIHDKPDAFALKFRSDEFPIAILATQLKYLQRAKDKLPSLYAVQAIIPPLSYEQCSGEEAANLKNISGKYILDLTGGLGIDTLTFAKQAEKVISVEQNADLQAITRYNFSLLGIENVEFVHDTAEHFIANYEGEKFDWIFIDPSRRDEKGAKVFLPENLQPNVQDLLPMLPQKCHKLMVKMSPLYDIAAAQKQFPNLAELWIISIQNECKELLLIWDFTSKKKYINENTQLKVICSHSKNVQVFDFEEGLPANVSEKKITDAIYIYEPDVAFYKARLCSTFFEKYYTNQVIQIHNEQGFAFSDVLLPAFPGRIFLIKKDFSYQPKALISFFKEKKITQLNILQRNFPFSAQQIAKSLKIKEGGSDFLICTLDNKGEKKAFWAERIYNKTQDGEV